MKILHLTTHLNRGGISNYIYSVGRILLRKGHEVFVGSSGGEMESEFLEQGFRLRNFQIRTKNELHPKLYLALPGLLEWIDQRQIDLIHAHTRITQVLAACIQRLTGRPYVSTAHGFYIRRLGRRLFPAWGQRVIAISDPVGGDLEETFQIPSKRIRVVYNGVDLQGLSKRFEEYEVETVRQEFGIPVKSKVVGITARLVSDKGHEYLIRAVKELELDIPDIHLLIVGEGRNREFLEQLAQELNLTPRIHFTGSLRDVSKPLCAMDVFALPAVWREGFGLSIVEAMACAKPIIATNIWALNALIQSGINGILVEPKNFRALAEAIRSILGDKQLRERIALAGQDTARERFSLERMAQELENVYEEVVRG